MRILILLMCIMFFLSCEKRKISLTVYNHSSHPIDSIYNIDSQSLDTLKINKVIKPKDSLTIWFDDNQNSKDRKVDFLRFYIQGKSYSGVWGNITGYPSEMINKINITDEYLERLKEPNKIDSMNIFTSEFKIDTLIKPLGRVGGFELSNGIKNEKVLAICSCQKGKNNKITIQLSSGIPTKKEMDSTGITDKSGARLSHLMDLGYLKRIDGRFQYLTIVLKDSIVSSIDLYSKSTELEYNGSDFKSMEIDKYKIAISTFDYSIASNVYGNFELILPQGFGYFENDTILKGHFECNNWKVSSKEEIRDWDIQEWFKKRNSNRGFNVK